MDIKRKKRYVTPALCCYEYDAVLSVICDSNGGDFGRPGANASAYSTTDDSGSDDSAYENQFDNNPFQ